MPLLAQRYALRLSILIRFGNAADVDAAVSVYERSNLARRGGVWPTRAAGVERVRSHLRDSASWFLLALDAAAVVGMASAKPLWGEHGPGTVTRGSLFLSYLFVVPERFGEGIGGTLLDAVLAEARRRHYMRVHLWTHEDNGRSHRLYRSRGFAPTGRRLESEGEWARDLGSVL